VFVHEGVPAIPNRRFPRNLELRAPGVARTKNCAGLSATISVEVIAPTVTRNARQPFPKRQVLFARFTGLLRFRREEREARMRRPIRQHRPSHEQLSHSQARLRYLALTTLITPNNPVRLLSGPAVKNSWLVAPSAAAPPPNLIPQS